MSYGHGQGGVDKTSDSKAKSENGRSRAANELGVDAKANLKGANGVGVDGAKGPGGKKGRSRGVNGSVGSSGKLAPGSGKER